jgi:hypothetical protein
MTDAQKHFDEFVIPTVRDFEKAPASRRHAFLACVAVFHAVDYLAAQPGSPKKQNLRNQLRTENADFVIVDRVAHAFKHMKSGHEGSNQNKPLHVQAVFFRPPSFLGVMVLGISYLGDTRGGVEIWNERGRDLVGVVKRAAEFIRTKI